MDSTSQKTQRAVEGATVWEGGQRPQKHTVPKPAKLKLVLPLGQFYWNPAWGLEWFSNQIGNGK